MATYGNSGGRNRGKKYIKLTGNEVATPENEARAREFMRWYGEHVERLRESLYRGYLDEDVMAGTALNIYEGIALKGMRIDRYWGYYLRAYHTNLMAAKRRAQREEARWVRLSDPAVCAARMEAEVAMSNTGEAGAAGARREEILEYVRTNYEEWAVALFEIYVGLWPDISYKRLARLLGWPLHRIWPALGAIRRGIAARFGQEGERRLGTDRE